MKVTNKLIRKVFVELDCTCQISMEFDDGKYDEPMGTHVFTACCTHEGVPGVEMIEMALLESIKKEIADLRIVKVQPMLPTTEANPLLRGEPSGAMRPVGTPASARPNNHRPLPKASSSGGSGIRLVDPRQGVSPGAMAHLAANKRSNIHAVDINEVAEDPRVTNLLESVMPLLAEE